MQKVDEVGRGDCRREETEVSDNWVHRLEGLGREELRAGVAFLEGGGASQTDLAS